MTRRVRAGLGAAALLVFAQASGSLAQTAPVAGGLASLPGIHALGPDLAQNGGFETNDGSKPSGWITDSAWTVDASTRRSGGWSVRLTDAPAVPFAQIARQNLTLHRGLYKLSGWIKTQDLGANTAGSGVRLNLDYSANGTLMRGLTPIVSGTTDWTYFETTNIVIPDDRTATLKLEAYKEPSGIAWFDDVRLEEQLPAPLETFLLYPNYRGMLFEDQSPTIRIDVTVTPPGGNFNAYDVVATLNDGATVIGTRTYAASPTLVAELDGGGMERGRLYDVVVSLIARSGGSSVYSPPAYRISRVPASVRAAMNVAFDDKNRILLHGTPRFVLGVYDSGLGYSTTDSYWEQTLWTPLGNRWMDGLRINVYLNYQFGHAPTTAMNALMSNLQRHGVMYLQTGNCFQSTPAGAQSFQIDASDDYVRTLGDHPGSAGYYTVDECAAGMVPDVFAQYARLRSLDADSMTFGALLASPPEVFLWSESADVLSTDPYPLFGAEPAAGYPHRLVADWTAVNREAVMNARPFMTVLQFFKFTSTGRWPTLAEMRSHAYMAIVEGARGLMWWSLGANALRDVCTGWCDEKVGYMANLKAVVGELADLEPALLGDDIPSSLVGNSQSAAIQTSVKSAAGKSYLFAYNRTSTPVSATFAWHRNPARITVHGEGRTITLNGNQFTDTFTANEAHAYVIEDPALTVAFVTPADGATVGGIVTVTAAASGGGSGVVYILSADGTAFGTGSGGSATWDTRALTNGLHTLTASVTDASGNTAATAITVTVANASVPAPPSGLTATVVSSSQINLAWTDTSGNESGFKIERSAGGGTFIQIGTVAANVTSYADSPVVAGVTYAYRVRTFNSGGDSAYSNTATATVTATLPVAPSSLMAAAASATRVNLTWRDNAGNEAGFTIFRSTGSGSVFVEIATVGPNVTIFADTTVQRNSSYKYRVRAFNSAGASSFSNTANAKTPR
jgi:fibronectin type III domain protein/Big-like domain-containing protein